MNAPPSVDDRLLALERRCVRLRIWCLALTSIALVACVTSAVRTAPDTIEAKSFVVRDPDGRIRIKLGVDGEAARLSLFSKEQQSIVDLSAWEKGTDSNGSGAGLYMEADGENADQLLGFVGGGVSGLRMAGRAHSIETFARQDGAGMRLFTERAKTDGQPTAEKPFPDDEAVGNPSMRLEIGTEKPTLEGFDGSGTSLFTKP